MSRRSCLTNLLEYLEVLTSLVDAGHSVDVIYLDFAKAFDNPQWQVISVRLSFHMADAVQCRQVQSPTHRGATSKVLLHNGRPCTSWGCPGGNNCRKGCGCPHPQPPHLEYAIQSWNPWCQSDVDLLENVQKRALRMASGLKGNAY